MSTLSSNVPSYILIRSVGIPLFQAGRCTTYGQSVPGHSVQSAPEK